MTSRGIRSIEVVTTRWDRVHRADLTVHESLDLLSCDVVEQGGVPVTTAVRTVVDLGASNEWLVERALEEGIRRGLFDLDEVEAFVARVTQRGRRGVGVIRPLLVARRRWDAPTESALEDRFRNLVADAGLPQARAQYVVRDGSEAFVCRTGCGQARRPGEWGETPISAAESTPYSRDKGMESTTTSVRRIARDVEGEGIP